MAEPRSVSLIGLEKRFGATVVVAGIDLEIAAGEFYSLLGPSGCGKTTTLRMVAGFEQPDAGSIRLGGIDITRLPPEWRDMGMVFQSYALFPHRTVAENVAFGLRMRGVAKPEITARVRAALDMVRLTAMEDRRPGELSGGQQQRVALARAIVINPSVLLCDEPLGALDKKLRKQMQFELKSLHRRLGLSLIYVTHDQEEALTMSDRIGVMRAGQIVQSGSPGDIYDRPVDRFVAGFIGDTNILDGTAADGMLVLPGGWRAPLPGAAEGATSIALRPERVRLVLPGAGLVDATVDEANFLGDAVLLKLCLPAGMTMMAKVARHETSIEGGPVGLTWEPADAVLLQSVAT